MALFSFGKKGDKRPQGPPDPMPSEQMPPDPYGQMPPSPGMPPPYAAPVEAVLALRQQGLSNNQIIQSLQQQGYPPNQVFDAMNQADVKGSVEGLPPEAMGMPPPENPMQMSGPSMGGTEERIEEIAEAIIDEKWNDLVKSVNKVVEWKERTDQKLAEMEERFKDMEEKFNQLHQGVLGKIGDYDQNITNLGSDIKAMEQVFQKILPSLTENVSELGRITKDIKKKR
ncbi:MAG: hypothetical protein KJ709_03330 [Nanoarchaeota archaeon]|nr:hypothetical protein [Nanoarchaeota archaeon]